MDTAEQDSITAQRNDFVGSALEHQSALIAATASPAVDLSKEELADMPPEIGSASESLQGEVPVLLEQQSELLLRSKRARTPEEENSRLKGKVERWRGQVELWKRFCSEMGTPAEKWQTLYSEMAIRMSEQKAYIEAAAAANKLRFEAEKGQIKEQGRERLVQFAKKTQAYFDQLDKDFSPESFDAEKARVAGEKIKEAQTCRICLYRPRNTVIVPCSHGQYCGECLEVLRSTGYTCPACSGPIQGTIPYIAH